MASGKRARDLRVERAAIAATELSLARCAELYMAVPVVDHGTDLLAGRVRRPGGKASDYAPGALNYRFPRRTGVLRSMLEQYSAAPGRWLELFDLTAIPGPTLPWLHADEAA